MIPSGPTGGPKKCVMVQVRTNLKAMCLSVYGVKLWNTLPDDVKNCTSVNIFKTFLKTHFISHYYTTLRWNESIIYRYSPFRNRSFNNYCDI